MELKTFVLNFWFMKLGTEIAAALHSAYVSAVSPSSKPERIQITLGELFCQRSVHTTEKNSKMNGMKKAMWRNDRGLTNKAFGFSSRS